MMASPLEPCSTPRWVLVPLGSLSLIQRLLAVSCAGLSTYQRQGHLSPKGCQPVTPFRGVRCSLGL